MSRVLRILRLKPNEWLALVVAYLYLMQAGWLIHVRHTRLDRWLQSSGSYHTDGRFHVDGDLGRKLAWYVNVASRHPVRWARCLQRSLALCLWLENRGLAPVLRVGVRKEKASIEAHAWVELHGEIINDGAMVEREFSRLRRLGHIGAESKTGGGRTL